MAAFLRCIEDNWFNFVQTLGIIAGLLFTAISVRREGRNVHIGERLNLLEQHRDLWAQMFTRPELQRVKHPNPDLISNPISTAEREFLSLVIVHFETGWQLAKAGRVNSLATLRSDASTFFNLPIPRTVWEETKSQRDHQFRRFVEESLKHWLGGSK